MEAFEQRTSDVPFRFCLYWQHLGTQFLHHPANVLLVFFYIKGTGTIYKYAALIQALPGVAHYLALQLPAFLHVLRAPFLDGSLVLAEHAFARARHIAEDEIETRLCFAIVFGVKVGDEMMLVAPLLHVFQQDAGPIADGLVAVEHTVLGQGCTQEC